MKRFKTFEAVKKEKFKIFCDMDGVLTDFDKGYEELTGMTSAEGDKKGPKAFWKPISDAGEDWWTHLDWMPDGKELWDFIAPYKPTILTSPSADPTCKTGKMKWLKRELDLGQDFYTSNPDKWKPHYRIIIQKHKHKFVRNGKNDILIDDTQKKIDAWREAGGTAILHTSTENTLNTLKEILGE